MPYINEYADKTSHTDIVNNPDIQSFLSDCKFMVEPTGTDIQEIESKFTEPPEYRGLLPNNIISIDGSNYEASVRTDIPCTRIGYVKIGNLLIKRDHFNALQDGNPFVNPFKVAALKDNNSSITFALPSSNIKYKDNSSVRDGFRFALDQALNEVRTIPSNPSTSLRATLFMLAAFRTGECEPSEKDSLVLHKCPSCESKRIIVKNIPDDQYCPHCNNSIYASDCLRIWEEISDLGSNQNALTRFMNVIEHIFAIHYIRVIQNANPQSFVDVLSNICFFIDGPLAIFGNSAWIHSSIMKYLNEINEVMNSHGKSPIMVLGLLKSGDVYDYMQLVEKSLPQNTIYCLEDDFRYKYITFDKAPSASTFGSETYYGQDFLFKTTSGRTFAFNVPYPFKDKQNKAIFKCEKANISNYTNIGAYTKLIEDFECDLYENAVVPIALAHKYTAISLIPGSKVLDLLSRSNIL
jgi:hypothetical protein